MSKIWIYSDPHFGHKKAQLYKSRGFDSWAAMDAAMIQTHNHYVGKKDTVYILGDVSFHNKKTTEKIMTQLKGHIHVIRGNHDRNKLNNMKGVASARDYNRIKLRKTKNKVIKAILSHFPFAAWEGDDRGTLMLHGHTHGRRPPVLNRIDVGWCIWGRPLEVQDIIFIASRIEYMREDFTYQACRALLNQRDPHARKQI